MSSEPLSLPQVRAVSVSSGGAWLFSAPVDLAVFLGSALLSMAALAYGAHSGLLYGSTPDWAWVPAILLIDVAHVWATGFRVYLDTNEWHRRPWLYSLVPALGFGVGMVLYAQGELVFWRTLAYLAVFHFVRQQYGWVMLYRARGREHDTLGRWIDTLAIYLATIYPLIYWHCHLPRRFWWFLKGDFTALPVMLERIAEPIYWAALGAYVLRSVYRGLVHRHFTPGKDIVVATTAVCWYVGIVALNSDYAFTVTNVIIHGIPYLALVYWYRQRKRTAGEGPAHGWGIDLAGFLAVLWIAAYVEEMFWDRSIWHDRSWLFGEPWEVGGFKVVLVPLLALPQITHYILDGFIWKRRSNPNFTLVS